MLSHRKEDTCCIPEHGGETGRDLLTYDRSVPTLELTYINGSLLLVSGQDPDLNVSFHECLNGLRDMILQLVLDRSGPEQLQVLQQKIRNITAISTKSHLLHYA